MEWSHLNWSIFLWIAQWWIQWQVSKNVMVPQLAGRYIRRVPTAQHSSLAPVIGFSCNKNGLITPTPVNMNQTFHFWALPFMFPHIMRILRSPNETTMAVNLACNVKHNLCHWSTFNWGTDCHFCPSKSQLESPRTVESHLCSLSEVIVICMPWVVAVYILNHGL
jgi:hypothetical protein